MGVFDFLQDWSPLLLALVGLVVCVAILVASFVTATAWRRWKEGKRRRAAHPGTAPTGAPTGVGFAQRAKLTKLPKLGKAQRK